MEDPEAERAIVRPFALTPRQRDVLTLAATGLIEYAIAQRLGLAKGTVSGHLYTARLRLQAVNTTHAVAIALTRGLIQFTV